MSEDLQIENVNKHYLDKVMDLAEEMDVEATEDIFDARGMKLIAKGAKISRALQERLILHKLRKPLESSITVSGGVNANAVLTEAQRIIDSVEAIACVIKASQGQGGSSLDVLSHIELGSAMSMMLTIVERGGNSAFEHSVVVSLIGISLAKRLGMSESDQINVALAGLLHDIGELYIAPEYLSAGRRLLPHEWRHVIVHPRIGQMLIEELDHYPPAVAQAVAEHHERFDGAGYPRQLTGRSISPAGQAIAVAEMISGLCMKQDGALARAELALKIVPGEHPHKLVSAVSHALHQPHQGRITDAINPSDESRTRVRDLFARISSVLTMSNALLSGEGLASKKATNLLSLVVQRTITIQRAFISTGLDICLSDRHDLFDGRPAEIMFEAAVATREIEWRLRDVARDLALQSTALDPSECDIFQPLIDMLDHGVDTHSNSVDA